MIKNDGGMSAGSDSVAGVLERAADLIEPDGDWTKYNPVRNGPRCIGYAIEAACGDDEPDAAFRALYRVAPFSSLSGLVKWNDAPERTQAEVVAKLREAAAKARSPQ